MAFVKNVKFIEPDYGDTIQEFITDIIDYQRKHGHDVIGKFNDVFLEVTNSTTELDLLEYYHSFM